MPRWLKVLSVVGPVLIVAIGGAYYWYFGDGSPPADAPPFALDLDAARARAAELPGGKASEVRVEKVASFAFPAVASVGGDGWNILPMAAYSYQIVLPADSIVIDAGVTAEDGASLMAQIDGDAFARMDSAMSDATLIVVTHEHSDHMGGILAHSEPQEIRKALRLNAEQVANLTRFGVELPSALSDYVPFDYDGMLAIAPGVVLIRAPGHTPGSQIVFVQCEDGREFLFIGDIGWSMRNIETGKGRPRVMSDLMLGEDRGVVFGQLAALKALHEAEPSLNIVPGHDVAAVDALVASGAMTEGFTP